MPRLRSTSALGFVAVLGFGLLVGCGDDDPADETTSAAGACTYPTSGSGPGGIEPPPADPTVSGDVEAVITTDAGDIGITLDADGTPCTVNSFVSLAEQDYYDDTVCHRLTTEGIFVLQCGDPQGTGMGGPGYTIPDEYDGSETYPPGTVAMARTPEPNSGGSQFFLVYEETPLPPEYTVFGVMDEAGTDLVRSIAAAGVDADHPSPVDGPPAQPITLTDVTVD